MVKTFPFSQVAIAVKSSWVSRVSSIYARIAFSVLIEQIGMYVCVYTCVCVFMCVLAVVD